MSNGQPVEDVNASNESAFQQLIWTIQMSEGQFVLILARCNYQKERSFWAQRLRDEECPVKLREIHLEESAKTLYTTVIAALKEDPPPPAVMVLGLESVNNLEPVLTSTNQVREEFRKNFAFPLILWVNDQILRQMIRLVPDFKSWSTTFKFALATNELNDLLQQSVDDVFSATLDVSAGHFQSNSTILNRHYRLELDSAISDLRSRGEKLAPDLKAGVQFLLGRDAYASGQIQEALSHYQASLAIYRQKESQEDSSIQNPKSKIQNRIGVLLFHIGLCHLHEGELQKSEKLLQKARDAFQQCVDVFEKGQCPDLAAKFIGQLGKVLQQLKKWDELQALVEKSLELHQTYGTSEQLAQDYGFLADVKLNQSKWNDARKAALQALQILANGTDETARSHRGSYLLLLAQAEKHLDQRMSAIEHLEEAQQKCDPQDDPKLYIGILEELSSLYYEQQEYLKAFEIKQKQRSIERQFGFRAFIGAGWLEPQQQAKSTPNAVQHQETVALEISVSERQQDVDRLSERMARDDCKLTVIYGQSGVGKSSIINAGLIPKLKQLTIATREVLPVVLRAYDKWEADLGHLLGKPTSTFPKQGELKNPNLIEQLKHNDRENLLTVLIFDQMEEFFFVYTEPDKKNKFFQFLSECLAIPFVKVIFSLREDYLHYLLELNRSQEIKIINNDILNKNILYYLGNFSKEDAKRIIQGLTERTQRFHLEQPLVERLVNDLASELNEVRPIELQIVGTQLQEKEIDTLEKYKKLGENPKEALVQSYLYAVVEACGKENEQAADLVLYLLTDEKNKRPLKTFDDLKRDLKALPENSVAEADSLKLVLDIFVKAGLVLLLPENPTKRYQLVHDYLVDLIRRQQEPKWKELLDKEKRKREQAEKELKQAKKTNEQAEKELKQAKERNKQANQVRFISVILSVTIASIVVALSLLWAEKTKNKLNIISKAKELDREGLIISKQIEFGGLEEPFIKAMKAGQDLKEIELTLNEMVKSKDIKLEEYPFRPVFALQQTLDAIQKQERLLPNEGKVKSISFSPTGQVLATVLDDGKLQLWNLQCKQCKQWVNNSRLNSIPQQKFDGVRFSPDGNLLAATSKSYIWLWKRQGNQINFFKEIKRINVKTKKIESITFSPDSKLLATVLEDGTAPLWDLQGKKTATIKVDQKNQKNYILCINFSPDGQLLATGLQDGAVYLWDRDGNNWHRHFKPIKANDERVLSVSFAPKGQLLATGSEDGTVSLWDLQGQPKGSWQGHNGAVISKPKGSWQGHNREVISISFSPDGNQLITASYDGTARLWDIKGIQLAIFESHEGPILTTSFSPDWRWLATVSGQGIARLWNLKHNNQIIISKPATEVRSVSFSKDWLLAVGSADGYIRLWECQGKTGCKFKKDDVITTYKNKSDKKTVYDVSFSPDGKQLASASENGTASLWDLKSHKQTIFKHNEGEKPVKPVRSISFSPDGKYLATASEDGLVKLWQPSHSEEAPIPIKPEGQQVFSISFSPNGDELATGSADGLVRLWDLKGNLLHTFAGGKSYAYSVSFSPDRNSNYLAIGYGNGTAELWDSKNYQLKAVLEGHSDQVRSVSFSPDGKYLATASSDGTARVWTLEGIQLALFKGHSTLIDSDNNTHPKWIDSVSFSPDGQWLATASRDNTARLWQIKSLPERLPKLLDEGCTELKIQNQSFKRYVDKKETYREELEYYQKINEFCQHK